VAGAAAKASALWSMTMARVSKRPAVSVALATYNGERFIREQLESILNQTVIPTEIVISDDNSSDQTVQIVSEVLNPERLKKLGITLKVVRNTTALGPGPNFEQAIKACSGDFIVLADQDDRWHPTKVDVLLRALSARAHALLAHSDATLVNAAGESLGLTLSEGVGFGHDERAVLASGHSLPAFIKRNLATGATMMFKRELVDMAFPLPQADLHDGWLALAASLVDGVVFIPEPLIDYRQHDSNQIGGTPLSATDSVVALLKSWRELTRVLATRNLDIQALVERLDDRVSAVNQQIVRERLAHNQWRIGLPASRVLRVWPVLGGVFTGRYKKYGRQPHDVLRDLLMPPRELVLGALRAITNKSEK
jgi:glycosyltransferase involved in cell wall biosynthesis